MKILILAGSTGIADEIRRRTWIRDHALELSREMTLTDRILANHELGSMLFSIHRAMGPTFVRMHASGVVVVDGRDTKTVWKTAPKITDLDALYLSASAVRKADVTALVVRDHKPNTELAEFVEQCAKAKWRVESVALAGMNEVSSK